MEKVKSNLKLLPSMKGMDENQIKLLSFIEKGTKIQFFCRSLDMKFETKFTGYFDRHKMFLISYPENKDVFSLKEKLNNREEGELCLATANGSGDVIGLAFKIVELTSEGILCEFPSSTYSLNRRKDKRYVIDSFKHQVFIEIFIAKISPKPIRLQVHDLSISGVACYIPVFLKNAFVKGQKVVNASLFIGSKKYPISVEIKNQLFNQNNNKFPYKVGMSFYNIHSLAQLEIRQFLDSTEN